MIDDNMAAETATDVAERIEEQVDGPHDLDPIDVKVTCSLSGHISDVTLVLGTGGPHVEFSPTSATVTVHWGDSHTVSLFDTDEGCDEIHDYYVRQFEERYLA